MFHSKLDAVKPGIGVFDQVNHIPNERTADAQSGLLFLVGGD